MRIIRLLRMCSLRRRGPESVFGYVRPLTAELRVRELEEYKAVYCGLCRTMGKRYGFLARFTLNYDFTFLVMVLADGAKPCRMRQCRCPAHPFRRRNVCEQMTALDTAADESLILSYQKLRDDVRDRSFLRSLPARIASLALKPAYRKAAAAQPEFDRTVTGCLEELHELEEARSRSLDRPADTFARILQAAAPNTGVEARDRALSQMLYHVGRWIYLIDAWDDLEKDIRSGAYNSIDARYEGAGREHQQDVSITLLHSRNLALTAYELAKTGRWDGIISNILYLGLPAIEKQVLSGHWKNKRNQLGE